MPLDRAGHFKSHVRGIGRKHVSRLIRPSYFDLSRVGKFILRCERFLGRFCEQMLSEFLNKSIVVDSGWSVNVYGG